MDRHTVVWYDQNDIRTYKYHGKTWRLPHLRTSTFRPQFMILFTNKINRKTNNNYINQTHPFSIMFWYIYLISTFLSLLFIVHFDPVHLTSFIGCLRFLHLSLLLFLAQQGSMQHSLRSLVIQFPVTGKSHSKAFYFLPNWEKSLRSLFDLTHSLLETLGFPSFGVRNFMWCQSVWGNPWQSGTLDKKQWFLERFFPFKWQPMFKSM